MICIRYILCFACLSLFVPSGSYAQVLTSDSMISAAPDTAQLSAADSIDLHPESKPDSVFHLYRINYWSNGIFCVIASAADVYAIPTVIKSKQTITLQELQGLNKNVLSGLDRWALEQDPSRRLMYQQASDYTLPVLIAATGLLAIDKGIRKDWFRLLMIYYEMHAITFSIYNFSFFGPAFQNKYRPVTYYDQLPLSVRQPGNNRNSMYSGHEATAIASTYFMVKVYSDYHPELGSKKYLLYALATIPPLVEGYLRVKGLEHFPSDVLVGLSIGAACGVLVPEVHRFKNHKVTIGLTGTPVGPGMGLVWNMD